MGIYILIGLVVCLVLVVAVLGFFEFVGMSGLIYPFYFCYACPWAWASCPLGIVEHSFIDMGYGEWKNGFLLLAYAIGTITFAGVLFGRYICGWACPIGALRQRRFGWFGSPRGADCRKGRRP